MTGLEGQRGGNHEAGTNRTKLAATLVVGGPVLSFGAFVWMILSVAQCQIFDLRIVASPLVGIGASLIAFIIGLRCLSLRPTNGRVAVLTIATVETMIFGWTLVWFGLCIPAAP